jgi:hypothetical protein
MGPFIFGKAMFNLNNSPYFKYMAARGGSKVPVPELFLPRHGNLSDSCLLEMPKQDRLSPLTLFVCTYAAMLGNLHYGFKELAHLMCENLDGCVLAVNSNYDSAVRPQYEHVRKVKKIKPERETPSRNRVRKGQGNGTCFNSTVEAVVKIDHEGLAPDKVYYVKCFSTTGETQVPGVVCPDLSDGHVVLEAFVAYLNHLKVGDCGGQKQITIEIETPIMLNYKFRVFRTSPRIILDLKFIAHYLKTGAAPTITPPFPIRELKYEIGAIKLSFRFRSETANTILAKKRKKPCAPKINIFQSGKINVLGAISHPMVEVIYGYFQELFAVHWSQLVCLTPKNDEEMQKGAEQKGAEQKGAEPPSTPRARLPSTPRARLLQHPVLNEESCHGIENDDKDPL